MHIWPATLAPAPKRKPSSRRNIGELHPKAVLTDHEVELLRQLRDEDPKRWSYGKLGEKFGIHRTTARSIGEFRTR